MLKPVTIGSRGSRLALWQARHVQRLLQTSNPELPVHVRIIKTTGDKLTQVALARIGDGKGVFVKEIEEALLAREIDFAVHSLKDVPTELPAGLILGAILPREDPRDVLISDRPFDSLAAVPRAARIGTGSLRRSVQLQHQRADLEIVPIRGNVDTRIRKLESDGLDGVVLARAGIVRLGLQSRISYTFSLDEIVPAVGQGALAVEIRESDSATHSLLKPLQDPVARSCVEAEREFLLKMGGGCQVPMGAHARVQDQESTFSAFVADPADGRMLRRRLTGKPEDLTEMARRAGGELLEAGGREILEGLGELPRPKPP